MSRKWLTALDLTKNEVQNAAFQVLGTAPSSPAKGQFYFDDTSKSLSYWDGTAWQTAKSGTGGPPTGSAGGDLTGSYPNPLIGTGKVTLTHLSATGTKDTSTYLRGDNTWAVVSQPTSLPPNGAAGGDLSGTYPNPAIGTGKVTFNHIADANVTAAKIADGNVTAVKLATDAVTTPKIMDFNVTNSKMASDTRDQANTTASMRTLSFLPGAAMPGNTALNGITAPTGALGMNGKQIVSLADPSSAQDAATKNYVDSVAQGLDAKPSVKAVATTSIGGGGVPGGVQTIDGFTTGSNDRVLLTAQSNPQNNGIYGTNTGGSWGRVGDLDNWSEVPSAYVWVEQGTTWADTGWVCTADSTGTIGTTAMPWVQFAGAGAGITQAAADIRYVNATGDLTMTGSYMIAGAGSGLSAPNGTISANTIDSSNSITGNYLGLSGSGAQLSVGGTFSSVDFSAVYSQVTLPAITPTATNHAATKAYVDGAVGSGLRKYVTTSAAATSTVAVHNFNTRAVQVQVYRTAAPYDQVECDVEHTNLTDATIRFATAPAAGEYQIVVIG